MYERIRTESRAGPDRALRVSVAVVLLLALLLTIPLIFSARLLFRFHGFTQDLAGSFVYGETHGGVRADYRGQSWTPRNDQASLVYQLILQQGMGHPRRTLPEGDALTLDFGDGSSLLLWAVEIHEPGRAADEGVLLCYSGSDGRFVYDTDGLRLQTLLNLLGYG